MVLNEVYSQLIRGRIFSVAGIRIFSLVIPFLCLPVILSKVGVQVLGQFYLIYSIISLFGFLDLGIPNTLMTRMAQVQDRESSKQESERIVRESAYNLVAIGLFATALISIVTWIFPVGSAFDLQEHEVKVFKISLILSVISLFLKFVGNLGLKVLAFRNKYQKSQILDSSSSSFGYLFAVLLTFYQESLLVLIISIISMPAIVVLLSTWRVIFSRQNSKLYLNYRSKGNFLKIGKFNFLFVYLQITTILMMQIDSIIVGSILTTSQVSTLNLCWKFFSIPYLIISSVYGFIWADASKLNQLSKSFELYGSVLRITKRLFIFSFAMGILVMILGQGVVAVWAPSVFPTQLFCSSAGIWLCLLCTAYPITMMLNGLGVSSYLGTMATINVLVNIIASFILTTILKDPAGVLLGSILGQIFGFFLPFYLYFIRDNSYRNRLKNAI